MLVPLKLLLQTTVPAQSVAVNIVDWPLHTVVAPTKIGEANVVIFTTISLLDALFPQLFVQTALYLPAVETLTLVVVAPFDH